MRVKLRHLSQFVVAIALEGRGFDGLYVRVWAKDHNHTRQLAAVFVEIFLLLDVYSDAFSCDDAIRARCPRLRINQQWCDVRRSHPHIYILVRPPPSERPPRFKMRVR